MFSRMLPENSMFFCNTIETPSRSAFRLYARTSCPDTRTEPESTSYSRGIICTSVDLPSPVPPMMPTVCPGRM